MAAITSLVQIRGSSAWVHENCYLAKYETRHRPQIDASQIVTANSKSCGDCELCGCPCVVKPRKVKNPLPPGKFRLLRYGDAAKKLLRFLRPGKEALTCYAGQHYWVDRDGNTSGPCNWGFSVDGRAISPTSKIACGKCGCIISTN